MWWEVFLHEWNSSSLFPNQVPSPQVTLDISGILFSCCAFFPSHDWFEIGCRESWHSNHIAVKELVATVIAFTSWGHKWKGTCSIYFKSNMYCTLCNTCFFMCRTSRNQLLMHLLCSLVFYAALLGLIS